MVWRVLVWAWKSWPGPPGGGTVGWSGASRVRWCDSAGAGQGQSVQLHLWPFCSLTTWPLTVFRCYMTRISEPWLFRAARAADSVYTEVSLVVGICMKGLTPPAKGQMTHNPCVCVCVCVCVWREVFLDKTERRFRGGSVSHLTQS